MPALIEETVILDVKCKDCQWSTGPFTGRIEAELVADSHDTEWHTPVLEDVIA